MAVKKEYRDLNELLAESELPVLVDFYAEWCGPCQMMAKVLDQIKTLTANQLTIVKINTEKYPQLAAEYRVAALPTLVLFQQGRPIHRIEGLLKPHQLLAQIQPFLA